jgi:hypothetical protein
MDCVGVYLALANSKNFSQVIDFFDALHWGYLNQVGANG